MQADPITLTRTGMSKLINTGSKDTASDEFNVCMRTRPDTTRIVSLSGERYSEMSLGKQDL